jgi:hypothetical protein
MNAIARMKSLRAAALAGAFGLAAISTFAAPQPARAAEAIPAGTMIYGKMATELDTSKSVVGDGFTIQVTRPYPNGDPSYAGAYIRGHVQDVQKAGQGRKAVLILKFDSIVLPDGTSAPLTGHVVKAEQKQKSAILQQAAGAAGGMIVGNILGKAVGTNLGGLVGAAGGFAYGNNLKTNFSVPANSAIQIQTDQLTPRPQAR